MSERRRETEGEREGEMKDERGEMISVGRIAAVTLWKIQSHLHIKGSFNQGKCYYIVPHWAREFRC